MAYRVFYGDANSLVEECKSIQNKPATKLAGQVRGTMDVCSLVLEKTAREAWKGKLITGSGSTVQNLVILLL